MQNQGKGKGGKAEKSCFVYGQVGHYAKDCWQAVRNVQAPRSQAGSSSTEWTNVTSVSNQPAQAQQQTSHLQGQGQQQTQQATQYRVSRISELNSDDIHGQGHFACDLRESPESTPKSNDGMVRAIHYYIGDDDFQSNSSLVKCAQLCVRSQVRLAICTAYYWILVLTLLCFPQSLLSVELKQMNNQHVCMMPK